MFGLELIRTITNQTFSLNPQILVKYRNFRQKSKISVNNGNFGGSFGQQCKFYYLVSFISIKIKIVAYISTILSCSQQVGKFSTIFLSEKI